jgi:hypothetical protein
MEMRIATGRPRDLNPRDVLEVMADLSEVVTRFDNGVSGHHISLQMAILIAFL